MQPHRAIPDAPHPEAVFRGDPEPLRFVDAETLTVALQSVDHQNVYKTGCVSFRGPAYEPGVGWVGPRVAVVYAPRMPVGNTRGGESPRGDDPTGVSTITIEASGTAPWPAHPRALSFRDLTGSSVPEEAARGG